VRAAAARVTLRLPDRDDGHGPRVLRWGEQLDVRPIAARHAGRLDQLDERAVAADLAKYVTKATTASALSDRPLTADDVALLDPGRHLHRLAVTAWQLGGRPELAGLRLRRWAHLLAFRGHVATRSRAYSTTLGRLRQARADHRRRQQHPDDVGNPRH
jgi:hypothetical protein